MSLYKLVLPCFLAGSMLGCPSLDLNQFDLVATHDIRDPMIYRKVHYGNKRVETDASGKSFEDYGKHFLIEEGKGGSVLYMDGHKLGSLNKDSRITIRPVAEGIVVFIDGKKIDLNLEEIASSD